MKFEDAGYGKLVRVINGEYKDQKFSIEHHGGYGKVYLANQTEQRYMLFSCDDLELIEIEK